MNQPSFNPFTLDNDHDYRNWRSRKLENYPATLADLVVQIEDPRRLTPDEHDVILARCRKANMALYVSPLGKVADKEITRQLGYQFGLDHLDRNMLAEDDGITSLAVHASGEHQHYIPYTDRPIKWHTDGYYNPRERQIWGVQLHCVCSAAAGGENGLLDHEIAYIQLRDANPDYIRALMAPDAMTIPARMDEEGIARPDETGPVFSLHPVSGDLHMRYTARTRSIRWKDTPQVRAAVAHLDQLLNSDSPYIFRARLEPGMGLISNNVLHDRAAFSDDENCQRLLYRARYYDRIKGTELATAYPVQTNNS
ncbi:MAG: TauD/TfdA family dioxygenase [Sulfuricella denitrificans]|nr:TauD/TfdA family dioxygenase [Sulfuricella denitrificans]